VSLFRVPDSTVCLSLYLELLDSELATFQHPGSNTTVALAREFWEGAQRPSRIEIPVAAILDGPLAEPERVDVGGEP